MCWAHIKHNERHGMGTAESIGGYDAGKLANLRRQLKNSAKNLADLLCYEWPSALDITKELRR